MFEPLKTLKHLYRCFLSVKVGLISIKYSSSGPSSAFGNVVGKYLTAQNLGKKKKLL